MAVVRQLHKQVNEENALQKSIIIMQENSAHFEEGIVRAIQSAWQTFDEWQSRMSASVQDTWRSLGVHMASIPPDHEWISFSARSDHLLDPDTPLRNPEAINYPSKEDPSVVAVHTGYLERKKRFTRVYRESYCTLTPSGFLHEYSSSDPAQATSPLFSLFLPLCTLGPAASSGAKSHKFHIEGRKDGEGSIKTGSLRIGRRSQLAWSFRSRSHDDMMEWWNDIRMLCARYLVASDSLERSGPVAAAVRAVGYLSEEEGEEGEEGSSVEEEGHEGEEEEGGLLPAAYHDLHEVDAGTEPPSYRGHPHGSDVGYTVRTSYSPYDHVTG
jgi:PH (Pleckstrin Homology) domain-containing protein/BAR-like protein